MNKICIFADVKDGAIGGKACAEVSGDPRCKLPTDGRCADQNGCGLHFAYESLKSCGVVFDVEAAQFLFVADVNFVDAVMKNLLRLPIDIFAKENGVNGLIDFVG